nr:hypothetical protein [Kineosphaera limosa]
MTGLCDDAAIFPPGSLPLEQAIPAHLAHRRSEYAELVGPLVLSAAAVGELTPLVGHLEADSLPVVVTVPGPDGVPAVLATLAHLPAVRLAGLEVALPDDLAAADLLPALDAALSRGGSASDVPIAVEVPRDHRRADIIAALSAPSAHAGSPYRAKFRTGGVRADLYPDEAELAAAIVACVQSGLPFKATAGLHHAIRNTDPDTGFEQHGFLNVLLATDAALVGADIDEVERILTERDGAALAGRVADLPDERAAAARAAFGSFGTCSVTDPLTELTDLGLIC